MNFWLIDHIFNGFKFELVIYALWEQGFFVS